MKHQNTIRMKTPNNRQQEQRNHRPTEVVRGTTSSISDSMCLSSILIRSHRVTMLTFLFQLQKTPISSEDTVSKSGLRTKNVNEILSPQTESPLNDRTHMQKYVGTVNKMA